MGSGVSNSGFDPMAIIGQMQDQKAGSLQNQALSLPTEKIKSKPSQNLKNTEPKTNNSRHNLAENNSVSQTGAKINLQA
jgi:hypothetical protein